MRVLIVDDVFMVRENLSAYLADEGYDVRVAETGRAGLENLQQHCIDLAVVDMRLPDISGDDFIRSASRVLKPLAFIIHTGSLEYALPDDIRQMGVSPDRILYKPLRGLALLASRVRKLLA